MQSAFRTEEIRACQLKPQLSIHALAPTSLARTSLRVLPHIESFNP